MSVITNPSCDFQYSNLLDVNEIGEHSSPDPRVPLGRQRLLDFFKQRSLHRCGSPRMKFLIEFVLVVSLWVFAGLAFVFYWNSWSNYISSPSVVNSRHLTDVQKWTHQDFFEEFKFFMELYNKSYETDVLENRLQSFKENMLYIDLHNKQNYKFSLGVNEFADFNNHEFKLHYTGNLRRDSIESGDRDFRIELPEEKLRNLPKFVDWRERGCVGEIKNQGQCGSCWAFAAVAVIEGAICSSTGNLLDLSEQQLVDCAGGEGNLGCNGGNAEWAWKYVENAGGLCDETEYPYTAEVGSCRAYMCPSDGTITQIYSLSKENELSVMTALQDGPVAVSIQGDQITFQMYKSGVFDGACGDNLNHAVTVVGYGTDSVTLQDYWTVRNSWGKTWGEDGYIRMARTPSGEGECGILMEPEFAKYSPPSFTFEFGI